MARLIDDKGRLFGKVSVVDIAVLAIIVALAIFIGLRLSGEAGTTETVPVKFTLLVQPTNDLMVDAFLVLGSIKDTRGRTLGSIVSAELSEPTPITVEVDGSKIELTPRSVPDVVLEVVGEGRVAGNGVHIGSTVIRVQATLKLIGPGWEAQTEVISVEQATAATD